MKATFATAGLCTMVLALALPAMLLAQEPVPAPVAPEQPPAEPAPVPPGETQPPPAEPPVAQETPAAEAEAEASAQAPVPVAAKASATVQMVDYAFSPATVTVNIGDSITWTNSGEEDHDAQGSGFGTGTVVPGSSGSATFSSAGSFAYVCTFHPDMKGTVVVNDPNAAPGQKDDGTVDPATGLPVAGTEAGAVTSSDAAGTADALPATGEPEAPLLILGAGLLACGALAGALGRWRSRETVLPMRPG